MHIEILQHKTIQLIAKVAHDSNTQAWIVGGFVRDIFLQRENKDIDIVVIGSGIDFAKKVALQISGNKQVAYFKNFGTAQIKTDDFILEFVGARKESYMRESRNPIIENGSLEDDQNRRDFTINSLYISLNKNNFGDVLDPFNGLKHIEEKKIITPLNPDITFSDDPLRMLRAVRFATRFNFTIAEETLLAIKNNSERIKIVSQERITEELNGIILTKKPSIGFTILFETGILKIIFPELVALHGIEIKNGIAHKDNFFHTLQVLDQLCELSTDLWLRWAAILHDIAKPATKRFEIGHGWTFHGHEDRGARMVKNIFTKMRLPQDSKMRFVEKLVLLHLRPIVLGKEEITDSAVRRIIVDAGEDLDALMLLCKADITSKNAFKVKKHLENLQRVQEKINDVIERDNLRNWQPPITGNHIMENFSIQNPKQIGELKNIIREAILDGVIPNSFEAAFEFMLKTGTKLNMPRK